MSAARELALELAAHLRQCIAAERAAAPPGALRSRLRTCGTRGGVDAPTSGVDFEAGLAQVRSAAWPVRVEVAQAVAAWGDDDAATVLILLASEDPEWRVRAAAVGALIQVANSRSLATLEWIVRNDPHPQPVRQAIDGLRRLALAHGPVGPRGISFSTLAGATRQPSPEAQALLRVLEEARVQHPDPSVRDVAAAALSALDA